MSARRRMTVPSDPQRRATSRRTDGAAPPPPPRCDEHPSWDRARTAWSRARRRTPLESSLTPAAHLRWIQRSLRHHRVAWRWWSRSHSRVSLGPRSCIGSAHPVSGALVYRCSYWVQRGNFVANLRRMIAYRPPTCAVGFDPSTKFAFPRPCIRPFQRDGNVMTNRVMITGKWRPLCSTLSVGILDPRCTHSRCWCCGPSGVRETDRRKIAARPGNRDMFMGTASGATG